MKSRGFSESRLSLCSCILLLEKALISSILLKKFKCLPGSSSTSRGKTLYNCKRRGTNVVKKVSFQKFCFVLKSYVSKKNIKLYTKLQENNFEFHFTETLCTT